MTIIDRPTARRRATPSTDSYVRSPLGGRYVSGTAHQQPLVEGSYVTAGSPTLPATRGTYVTTPSRPVLSGGSYTYMG